MDGERSDDTRSGATAADTPRNRGQANIAALPARFTVKATLGEGGMGTVVEAYDRALGRDVAIKLLAHDTQGDASVGARFIREARAAAQLRHPGIVQVHDIDPEGEYIVMELVRGEALSARLKREKTLPVAEVRRIGGALLEALGVAHGAGIVHRDVKPANVLLGEHGEVKLTDFGVAFFGDSDLTMPGSRIGTPAYMAPEQLRARSVDARADVYAAGATLFETATGKRLHDDDAHRECAALVIAATGDRTLAAAIERAVRERPADRFPDAQAFAAALDATDVAPPPRARKPPRTALIAVSVAALAIGIGAYAVSRHGTGAPVAAAPEAGVARGAIALLPFTDETKDPLLDFAASGLPNLLGLELHAVPEVSVIGYYQLLGNVSGPEAPEPAWRAAALKLGAGVIVHGKLTAANDKVRVVISVEGPNGEQLAVIEREAKDEEIPEVVRAAAPQIAKAALGRMIDAGAHAPTAFVADRELQLGIALLEREHLEEALEHLQAAARHAPDMAMAQYYLAVVLYWRAPPAEPARAAIDKALSLGLDEAHRGFLAGIRFLVGQDYVRGIDALRPLAEKYPNDKDILYALFEALFHGGHPADAMSVYRRLIAQVPRFRLALIHAFTFYVAHADDAGSSWALALADPTGDAYNRIWEPRILIGRREYAAALKLLQQTIEQTASKPPGNAGDLQSELATVYALTDQLDLATALETTLGQPDVGATAQAQLGLATARGDAAGRERWRAIATRNVVTQPPGPGRSIAWSLLAGQELAVATQGELDELSRGVDGSVVADYERSLNLNVLQTLVAEGRNDPARVAELAKSQYPEVRELAAAATARKAGDRKAAAASTSRAIAATGDARFVIDMWFLLAGDRRALADQPGVIAACDEVIRPRLFSWQWGATVGPCLAWTAEASEATGKLPEARAAWHRLLAIRSAAPATDPLVKAARTALARLGR